MSWIKTSAMVMYPGAPGCMFQMNHPGFDSGPGLDGMAGTVPDSTATAELRGIAGTCLSDGGRAVLGARGLSKVVLKEYYDDNNCQQPQGRSAGPNDRELTKVFVIVPNPANQEVSIRLEAPVIDTGELQVVTLQGQLMHRATLGDNQQEILIHTSNWPSGIYLVKLHNKEGSQVRTLVIQH